jgi:hypothetical protein
MTPQRVELSIQSDESESRIPARTVADRLYSLQAALMHIGDYLTGSDFRQRGGSPAIVRKKCTLYVAQVAVGSFSAGLELPAQPPATDGELGLGDASVAKLRELVSTIEGPAGIESRVDAAIADPRHRTRIMKDLLDVWPDEGEGLAIQVAFPGQAQSQLTPNGRLVLEGLLARQRDAEQASVKGILGTAHVTPGDAYIRLTGPDGRITCRMTNEQQEAARRLLGKPTIVYGQAEFDSAGNVREITSVDRIEPFRELTLLRVFSGEDELVLRQSVSVGIDYAEDRWVASNDDIGIVAMEVDYDDCLRSFQDEFFFAWREYGRADDSTLTEGARELKRALLSLVQGEGG